MGHEVGERFVGRIKPLLHVQRPLGGFPGVKEVSGKSVSFQDRFAPGDERAYGHRLPELPGSVGSRPDSGRQKPFLSLPKVLEVLFPGGEADLFPHLDQPGNAEKSRHPVPDAFPDRKEAEILRILPCGFVKVVGICLEGFVSLVDHNNARSDLHQLRRGRGRRNRRFFGKLGLDHLRDCSFCSRRCPVRKLAPGHGLARFQVRYRAVGVCPHLLFRDLSPDFRGLFRNVSQGLTVAFRDCMELVRQFSPRLLVRFGHGGLFVQYFREFLHFSVRDLLALPLGLLVGLRQGILGFIEPLPDLFVFHLRGIVGACYTRFLPASSFPQVLRLPGEFGRFTLFRSRARPFHGFLDAFADGLGIYLPACGVLSDPCLHRFFDVVEDRSGGVFRAHLAA